MAQPTTIKSGDPRNDVSPSVPKGFSTFDLSHRFLQTHRFGEVTPHESFETVKGAKDSLRLMNDTSSYSLKAPLKTEMFQKRSNFFVPLQAIIRNNWELVTAQPNDGDDVAENVDGVVDAETLTLYLQSLATSLTALSIKSTDEGYNPDSSAHVTAFLGNYIRNLLQAEMFFSQGSLLKQLYFDFSHCVSFRKYGTDGDFYTPGSFDAFSEKFLSSVAPTSNAGGLVSRFEVNFYDEDYLITDQFEVVPESYLSENPTKFVPGSGVLRQISYRHFLDLARQNLNFRIVDVEGSSDLDVFFDSTMDGDVEILEVSSAVLPALFGEFVNPESNLIVLDFNGLVDAINFDKVSAYQIICAHFFSLDHVDYIYSAELYRQMMQYYFDQYSVYKTFSWNGLDLHYDALSGHAIAGALTLVKNPLTGDISSFDFRYAYMTALFSFRHSLRYLDYFTGGRTRPLSVGSSTDPRANVNVAVNNNAVNGVEMILAQNAARYLNFAQRTGRKISQWLEKMFPGGQPKPDFHDPQWLSSTGDGLSPEQVQNTGEAQATEAQSITARFKADSNNYMFTIQPDRPGYIICVTYYDVPRAYAFATHKENMHANRYDRFNPFFQYNGSQQVSRQELGVPGSGPFSYQGRYEEYKQNYDVCAGGFVENLPGFAFVADLQSGLPMQEHLNPTYVRSWNCELDPFYLSLTGYGLAAYFHFIVKNVNVITAVRPMEYAPQLM